jgi:hypothetical protein
MYVCRPSLVTSRFLSRVSASPALLNCELPLVSLLVVRSRENSREVVEVIRLLQGLYRLPGVFSSFSGVELILDELEKIMSSANAKKRLQYFLNLLGLLVSRLEDRVGGVETVFKVMGRIKKMGGDVGVALKGFKLVVGDGESYTDEVVRSGVKWGLGREVLKVVSCGGGCDLANKALQFVGEFTRYLVISIYN